MISKEQIQDWAASPVTRHFFDLIKELQGSLREEPRYSIVNHKTSDNCGMFNAYVEGSINALEDVINFREEMMEADNENNP